jgi:hypothetical protein
MSTVDSKSKQAMGFLTVVEHPQYGLFGGYLLLNAAGRPLEFHCTAPIKPNRAQKILYGPTLQSFLYGEQIGQTLISQGTAAAHLIFTDREPALAAREYVSAPLALVLPGDCPDFRVKESGTAPFAAQWPEEDPFGRPLPPDLQLRLDAAHRGPRLVSFQLGRNRLALPREAEADRRLITERMADLAESFDLAEPFQRIRDAIEEAQQAVR